MYIQLGTGMSVNVQYNASRSVTMHLNFMQLAFRLNISLLWGLVQLEHLVFANLMHAQKVQLVQFAMSLCRLCVLM